MSEEQKEQIEYFASLLERDTTVQEIVAAWGYSRKAVMMHIYRDHFQGARKSSSAWLVPIKEVVKRWGMPKNLGVFQNE
jgi:hypothetical protein